MSPRVLIGSILGAVVLAGCSGALAPNPDAVISPQSEAPTLEVVVLAADDLVAGESEVRANGELLEAAAGTVPVIEWTGDAITLDVEAAGFQPWSFVLEDYPEAGTIEFRLEPVVLSGIVTTDSGRPLPGARVTLGGASDTTDNEGRYALDRAVAGTIVLDRPAWETAEFTWDGSVTEVDMTMSPVVVRALRVSPEAILERDPWEAILSLADLSGIDAVAIDLKTEDGTVVYPTEVVAANAIGAVSPFFDAREVVAEAKEHDLYTIARIGVFQDNFYAAAEPETAILTADGSLWRSRAGFAWLDPSDPEGYGYSIALAEEACRMGFDEIQFNYASYPPQDVSELQLDGAYNQEVRVASVASYLERAYSVLHPLRCTVSTEVFGIILESDSDEGVGQRPGTLSRIVDVLSPTLYTTNYGPGWKGYEDPNAFAEEIIDDALRAGAGRVDGYGYLRPWLQTWTISTADQRAVQSIATDSGLGWMLWSNSATYSADILPPR